MAVLSDLLNDYSNANHVESVTNNNSSESEQNVKNKKFKIDRANCNLATVSLVVGKLLPKCKKCI